MDVIDEPIRQMGYRTSLFGVDAIDVPWMQMYAPPGAVDSIVVVQSPVLPLPAGADARDVGRRRHVRLAHVRLGVGAFGLEPH